jgi:hypothetical protein
MTRATPGTGRCGDTESRSRGWSRLKVPKRLRHFIAHRFGADATTTLLSGTQPAAAAYLVFDSLIYNALVPIYQIRPADGQRPAVGRALTAVMLLAVGSATALCAEAILPPGWPRRAPGHGRGCPQTLKVTALSVRPRPSPLFVINVCRGSCIYAQRSGHQWIAPARCRNGAGLLGRPAITLPAAFALLCLVQYSAARRGLGLGVGPATDWKDSSYLRAAGRHHCGPTTQRTMMNAMVSYGGDGAVTLSNSYIIAQAPWGSLTQCRSVPPACGGAGGTQRHGRVSHRLFGAGAMVNRFIDTDGLASVDARALVDFLLCTAFSASTGRHGPCRPATPGPFCRGLEALSCRCLFALRRHWLYFRTVAPESWPISRWDSSCTSTVRDRAGLGASMAIRPLSRSGMWPATGNRGFDVPTARRIFVSTGAVCVHARMYGMFTSRLAAPAQRRGWRGRGLRD